jgi:HEAT repeat protein
MKLALSRFLLCALLTIAVVACEPENTKPSAAADGDNRTETKPGQPKTRGNVILQGHAENPDTALAARLMEREQRQTIPATGDESELVEEYAGAEPERRAEILAALGAGGAPEWWDFLCQAAGDGNFEVRAAALDALAAHGSGDPSAAILKAMEFSDEETRALAASLLDRRTRNPASWARAATDRSTAVRVAYLAAVEAAPDRIKLSSARSGLASGDPQLRKEAASVLGGVMSKEAVEMLIPLLDETKTSDVAGDGLFFLLGAHFDSASEAHAWWSANKANYDENLEGNE